jgi:hypothetical protein
MDEDIRKTEALVHRAFEYDRVDVEPSEDRLQRIMQRVRSAIAAREIGLLIFVRMWLAVLEFGAAVYGASSPHLRRDPRRDRSSRPS